MVNDISDSTSDIQITTHVPAPQTQITLQPYQGPPKKLSLIIPSNVKCGVTNAKKVSKKAIADSDIIPVSLIPKKRKMIKQFLNLTKLEDTKKKTQVGCSSFVKEAQKGKRHLDEAQQED